MKLVGVFFIMCFSFSVLAVELKASGEEASLTEAVMRFSSGGHATPEAAQLAGNKFISDHVEQGMNVDLISIVSEKQGAPFLIEILVAIAVVRW